jgi:hypothetical protein
MTRLALEDEIAQIIRRDTARQMRAFGLIEASLAERLPATLRPLAPSLPVVCVWTWRQPGICSGPTLRGGMMGVAPQ